MGVVIDASIALAWLLPDEDGGSFDALLTGAGEDPPLVTGLWLYEVSNALVTAVRKKRMPRADAEEALDLVSAVPVNVKQFSWIDMRASFRIANEHGLSLYDASYLQLALQTGASICTLDNPMRRAAEVLKIPVYA
jgi:predicted nucleic acid-binding protein